MSIAALRHVRSSHVALLLAVAIYLVALYDTPLQLPDEPREAEIAREMWVNGPLSVPRVNGELHPIKPPLMYWAAAAIMSVRGERVPRESSPRLAAALFSVGTLALLAIFGALWLSPRHGALAFCVLALCPENISHGRRFLTDPALAFCVTATVGCAITALRRPDRERLFMLLTGVALGLGFLAKGPVAVVLSALAVAGAILAARGPRGLVSKPALGVAGYALAGFVPALLFWIWLLCKDGGTDTVLYWFHYHVGGVKGEAETPHVKPFWFYLTNATDGVMPWIFFTPLLAWRKAPDDPRRPLVREVAAWAIAPLLFLSAMAQKRDVYTLPILPPVAFLGAWAILDCPKEGRYLPFLKYGWQVMQAAFAVGAIAGCVYGGFCGIKYGDWDDLVLAVVLFVLGAAAVHLARNDPEERDATLSAPFATLALAAIIAISLVAFFEGHSVRKDRTLRRAMKALIDAAAQDPTAVLHGYKLGDGTAVVNGALAYELGGTFDDIRSKDALSVALVDSRARVIVRKANWEELGRPGRKLAEATAERHDLVLIGR